MKILVIVCIIASVSSSPIPDDSGEDTDASTGTVVALAAPVAVRTVQQPVFTSSGVIINEPLAVAAASPTFKLAGFSAAPAPTIQVAYPIPAMQEARFQPLSVVPAPIATNFAAVPAFKVAPTAPLVTYSVLEKTPVVPQVAVPTVVAPPAVAHVALTSHAVVTTKKAVPVVAPPAVAPVAVAPQPVVAPVVAHQAIYSSVPQVAPIKVDVPIVKQQIYTPIQKNIHYGLQPYVAGSTSSIYKPTLSAPAIGVPSILKSKLSVESPEVTVQKQQINIERLQPHYFETPYRAGTVVKYTQPEVRTIKISKAVPVASPVAVPYAQPVAVPDFRHVAVAESRPTFQLQNVAAPFPFITNK